MKLKNINDYYILQQIALQKNVEIVKQVLYMPQWYIMVVSNGNNNSSLELGNQFYETGLFEAVDPAFMLYFSNGDEVEVEEGNNLVPIDDGNNNDATCSYDPDFSKMWGLKNTSNPAYDINACQAWRITQGANVNVAVVDEGIYTAHGDLTANLASWSFDAQSGTSPSVYVSGNSHGTKVAGVIAAVRNNNLHIVGVAPKSIIVPVSHDLTGGTNPYFTTSTMSAQLAEGITWAYQSAADIINNSWGEAGVGMGSSLYSTILEDAIVNAMTFGRDGKGCIVVFSSGNILYNDSSLLYPGNFDDRILTVGAITKLGARWSGSKYGSKLDVVAPGSGIYVTTPPNTIIENDGTSFAAPHGSGVAALILSVNPCLTGQQVTDIIEQTSQKVRKDIYTYTNNPNRQNGTWNEQMGYGLVDAYAAVMMASSILSTNPCDEGIQQTIITGTIDLMVPNPATNNVVVKYNLVGANSATLTIVKQTGSNTVYNYTLDFSATETSINISDYMTGNYTVALIVHGEVVDSKTLIKQ